MRIRGQRFVRMSRTWLLGATAAVLIAVGAGGAQAAGGALDPSFGKGGKVLTDLGSSSEWATAVAVQADGRIVVAGRSGDWPYGDFTVVRYGSSGKLDASFGRGGKAVIDLDGGATAVAIQRDGKIVVAGWTGTDKSNFALVRYTRGGKLDARFGKGGKVVTDFGVGRDDWANSVVVQSDGRIVVAGTSDSEFALVRYAPGGTLDASFGTRGKVLTDIRGRYDDASALALQKDGRIVVGGSSGDRRSVFVLVRYTGNGKPDTTFGHGGKVLTDLGGTYPEGTEAVAVQEDGKVVAVGGCPARGTKSDSDFAVVRYTSNGKMDTSFGQGGKVLTDFGGRFDDSASALVIQPDGKLVVAGGTGTRFKGDFALVRYTTGGGLDVSFGKGGKVRTNLGGDDWVNSIAAQADGKIVAAGASESSPRDHGGCGSCDFALARYTK